MATIILVPGFWLGGWAWDAVAPPLRAAGHDVRPLTLTGVGERAWQAAPQVDLETHIADVVEVIEKDDLRDVVLVAHSGGTSPVTGAADRVPDRVARVVYVDTGPLPHGMPQIDFHEPSERARMRERVAAQGDGWLLPPPPFDPVQDPVNLAGLSQEDLALMRRRATPQPFGTVTEPLRRPSPLPRIPLTLIACTFAPEMAERLAASGVPAFSLMAGPHWSRRELPTGHWPMFSRPADLAALIDEAAGPRVTAG